jgi:hypothetical protein
VREAGGRGVWCREFPGWFDSCPAWLRRWLAVGRGGGAVASQARAAGAADVSLLLPSC